MLALSAMASSVARAQYASRMQVAARLLLSGAKEGNAQGCLSRGTWVFSSPCRSSLLDRPLRCFGSDVSATSQSPQGLIEDVKRRIEKVRNRSFTSKYHGVARTHPDNVRRKPWRASITIEGKSVSLGRYATEEEGARAFDEAVREKDVSRARRLRSLNFKVDSDYFDIQTWEQEPIPEGKTSRFLGVRGRRGKCMALTLKTGRSLGVFASELEAAASFDKASLAEDGPTNFHPRTQWAS